MNRRLCLSMCESVGHYSFIFHLLVCFSMKIFDAHLTTLCPLSVTVYCESSRLYPPILIIDIQRSIWSSRSLKH